MFKLVNILLVVLACSMAVSAQPRGTVRGSSTLGVRGSRQLQMENNNKDKEQEPAGQDKDKDDKAAQELQALMGNATMTDLEATVNATVAEAGDLMAAPMGGPVGVDAGAPGADAAGAPDAAGPVAAMEVDEPSEDEKDTPDDD